MPVFRLRWIRASFYFISFGFFVRFLVRIRVSHQLAHKRKRKRAHTNAYMPNSHAHARTYIRTPHPHVHWLLICPKQMHWNAAVCLVAKQTEHSETKTDSMKTETPTTVSKRTLCWSRHIEIDVAYSIYCQWVFSDIYKSVVFFLFVSESSSRIILFSAVARSAIP